MKSLGLIALALATTVVSLTPARAGDSPQRQAEDGALHIAIKLSERALAEQSQAWPLLESLTTEIGARPAGGPAMHRAADWAVREMRRLGFENVHVERFPLRAWRRGPELAEVLSPFPQRLVISGLGESPATPPGGVSAEIAFFRTYDAFLAAPLAVVGGKIVVIDEPMPVGGYKQFYRIRADGPVEAARRGAVGYLLRSLTSSHHRLAHTGAIDAAADGVRPVPAAALAPPDADQLERMAKDGKPVRLRLLLGSTVDAGATGETVVGELIGSSLPDQVVLIGAHLDSWDLGAGALDDGAGVAITLAAAHLIAEQPDRPRRTIRVALFGAEEVDGSNLAYAQAHPPGERASIVLASECDDGADLAYAIQLPKGFVASDFARALASGLQPTGVSLATAPAMDGGADLALLPEVPKAKVLQDTSRYFTIHHSADDVLDQVDPHGLAQNVAAWAAFTYLAADLDLPARSITGEREHQP